MELSDLEIPSGSKIQSQQLFTIATWRDLCVTNLPTFPARSGLGRRRSPPLGKGLPFLGFIVYRRLTMKDARPLDRATAAEYATWFKALSDATRIQIVSLLARRGVPMTVGQIVAAVQVGQSTVSAHLKVLAEVGFVLAEHKGTASYYWVNDACVECFPSAADVVMGRPVPVQPVPAGRS